MMLSPNDEKMKLDHSKLRWRLGERALNSRFLVAALLGMTK